MINVFLQKINQSISSLSYRQSLVLALLAGAGNVLSFAPFFLWPLQVISLALIFTLYIQHPYWNNRQIALLGLSYSFSWLFIGVSWLLIALSRYGGLPMALSVIALALFVLYLSLYSALAFLIAHVFIQRWQCSKAISLMLIMPSLWTLFEGMRGYVMTGFPWLSSGYAHSISPLAGFSPVIGVYGLSLIGAMLAGVFTIFIVQAQSRLKMGIVILGIMFLGVALQQLEWTKPKGKPISVRLLQGNIDQGIKFDSNFVLHSLDLYEKLITEQASDLILTPETALPVLSSQLPIDYLPRLRTFSTQTQSHIMLGIGMDDGNQRYANSIVGLSPHQADMSYRYDKHHLVPFGEFVPLGFRWFINLLRIPLGEFSSRGLLQEPMQIKDQLVLPNICYEDLFGDEIAKQLLAQSNTKNGAASILFNSSNLAWYGDSIAIPQHLQISQMRSLETGRPMLRATNTGATAIINERGIVVSQLAPLTKNVLAVNVQGMQGLTPYIQYGDAGVLLLIIFSLLTAIFFGNRKFQGL